jgi:hypothetical protein
VVILERGESQMNRLAKQMTNKHPCLSTHKNEKGRRVRKERREGEKEERKERRALNLSGQLCFVLLTN